ncbi:MAG: hypothetical protein ACC726_00415 [Chloroflexota bacterium]
MFDALERLDIRYFITGSVAASVYGVLRQSHDTDIVLDLDVAGFGPLASELRSTCAVADPIDFGTFAMASAIDLDDAEKVDLILQRPGPFEASAMDRRQMVEVPGLGQVWVASIEDLVLAKLVWSEGTSELQLKDCAQLLRINAGAIDQTYLERWAARLDVTERLGEVG